MQYNDLEALRALYPNGVLIAKEFCIGSVHGEKGLSLKYNIVSGLWGDFATGERGKGLASLIALRDGISYEAAIKKLRNSGIINGMPSSTSLAVVRHKRTEKNSIETQEPRMNAPVPDAPPTGQDYWYRGNQPTAAWSYYNERNEWQFSVRRFDTASKKVFLPLSYDGQKFVTKMPDGLRPPFGIARAIKIQETRWEEAQARYIIIVEGEKCAATLAKTLRDFPILSWAGGTASAMKTDWSAVSLLNWDRVILWPDADKPGVEAMEKIATALIGLGKQVDLIDIEPNILGSKIDCADRILKDKWDSQACLTYLETARTKVIKKHDERAAVEPPVEASSREGMFQNDAPFYPLGHNDGVLYFLKDSQIYKIAGGTPAKDYFFLAPLHYWMQQFPARSNDSFNHTMAFDHLMCISRAKGVYDPGQARGNGVWKDRERVVVNLGDRIYYNGMEYAFPWDDTRCIYSPTRERLPVPIRDNEKALKYKQLLMDLCMSFSWRYPSHGVMLCGWIMCAYVAGALPWRPHLWLNSENAGAGKTSLLRLLIKPALGKYGIAMEGATEAGIRQSIGMNSRAVTLDEAEPDQKSSSTRLNNILQYIRSNSAGEEDGTTFQSRGGMNGQVTYYAQNSIFLLSSISRGYMQDADKSRFCLIELGEGLAQPDWYALEARLKDIPEDLPAVLSAYMLDHYKELIRNFRTLKQTIQQGSTTARFSDQVGMLLAGASMTYTDTFLVKAVAEKMITEVNINRLAVETGMQTSYEALLQGLLSIVLRVQGDVAVYNVPVSEAIRDLFGTERFIATIPQQRIVHALSMVGIHKIRKDLYIEQNNKKLRTALETESCFGDYFQILNRSKDWEYAGKISTAGGREVNALKCRSPKKLVPDVGLIPYHEPTDTLPPHAQSFSADPSDLDSDDHPAL